MTNVPDDIRAMWTDIYKLFDINYKMKNDMDSWNKFWSQAEEVMNKHGRTTRVQELVTVVAGLIEDRIKSEEPKYPCTLEDMDLF